MASQGLANVLRDCLDPLKVHSAEQHLQQLSEQPNFTEQLLRSVS
jgi:hypothetical protein